MATPFVLIQWNLKRLLAYSSVEHVGIMAIGLGLGGRPAVFGALLHMTYHTFAKPVAFFSAGTLAQLHRSSDLDTIGGGTFGRTPIASGLLLLATLMVTGSPPFGLFWSEMLILRAGFAGPHLVVVAPCSSPPSSCCSAASSSRWVAWRSVPRHGAAERPALPERLDLAMVTTLAAAILAVVSAFYLPGALLALVHAAVRVVEGA